jgi:hypothetical protein
LTNEIIHRTILPGWKTVLKNRDGTPEGKTGLESRDRKQGWNTGFEKSTEGDN